MQTTLDKLSGTEQKVYFHFEERDQRVIVLSEVAELLGISRKYASKILSQLARKNACEKVKSGLYIRFPASIVINKGAYREDPLLLAGHLEKDYFFSYYTALYLHGISQRITNLFYLSNTSRGGELKYHGHRIRLVKVIPERFFGSISKEYAGRKIFVSDPERTFLDVVHRPEYVGGWQEGVNCLRGMRNLEWDKLMKYLELFHTKSLFQRTGYILDTLRDVLGVPDDLLTKLEKRVSPTIYYFKKGRGRLNRRWNVIVEPELLGE